MHHLDPSEEHEAIVPFLAAEFSSPRLGETLYADVRMHVVAPAIVTAPDVDNDAENTTRRFLLAGPRGSGRDIGMFYRFPSPVQWYRAILDRQELSRVRISTTSIGLSSPGDPGCRETLPDG